MGRQLKSYLQRRLRRSNMERVRLISQCWSDLRATFRRDTGYPIPIRELRATLVEMGIERGDVVHFQSSLSHLYRGWKSPSEGRSKIAYAKGVVEMLLELIGSEGTVTMRTDAIGRPFGWLHRSLANQLSKEDAFDYRGDPSRMGFISEVFRLRPDVVRSVNPYSNVSAWGRLSEELIKDHHLSTPYALDRNSPWYKLTQMHGKIALLGRTFDINSPVHLVEHLHWEKFPRPIFFGSPVRMLYVDRDGETASLEIMLHTRGAVGGTYFVPESLFKFSRYLNRKYSLYQTRDFSPEVQVVVYDALAQYEAVYAEMKADVTWYDVQFLP